MATTVKQKKSAANKAATVVLAILATIGALWVANTLTTQHDHTVPPRNSVPTPVTR